MSEVRSGSSVTSTGSALTMDKLREAVAILKELPPRPAFDLWPHDLPSADMYELKGGIAGELGYITKGRRQLVVPRARLELSAYELRLAGADVRVEPKIRQEEPRSE
jgi:hypothetical protein